VIIKFNDTQALKYKFDIQFIFTTISHIEHFLGDYSKVGVYFAANISIKCEDPEAMREVMIKMRS